MFNAFSLLADDAGYGKYLQSHAGDWRQMVLELLPLLVNAPAQINGPESIVPDEMFIAGSVGALGRSKALVFRSHGIALQHCLGLIKLLRTPFLKAAHESCDGWDDEQEVIAIILRILDKFDLGFVAEWHGLDMSQSNRELRAAKHFILLEKRRYYMVFHRMAEPAFVVDNNSMLCDVNHAFEDFFGVKARDIIGRHCSEVLEEGLCAVCDHDNALANRGSFAGVELRLSVCGANKTVLLSGTSLGEFSGELTTRIFIVQDITDKKRIEEALVENEEKYRSLIENMPDGTWRADGDGNFLFVSPNVKRLCGYSINELYQRGRFADIHPDDLEAVRDAYANLFEHQMEFNVRYRFRTKKGDWIWLHDRAVSVTEKNGHLFADGILTDVTYLKKVEDELNIHQARLEELVEERTAELNRSNNMLRAEIGERQQIEKELRLTTQRLTRSNADLEQFAYVVSHDLREPLMLIVAFTERLLQRYGSELEEKGMEYLQRVLRAARRLENMVEDLLQLSRISSRGLNIEELDLSDLMSEVVENLEERIRQVKGRVDVGLLQFIEGDRLMVQQLFQNVICNALKYRKDDVEPLVIVEGRLVNGDFVEVSVTDNGIGFDEKYLDRIFIPFERLECGNKYEGTGIGLATCEKIVVHHGGMITAHSQPGVGTTFIIRLPRRHPDGETSL